MCKLYIVMYHYVRKPQREYKFLEGIKGLNIEQFKEQLDFFEKNFNIITMEELIYSYENKTYGLPQNSLLLTFDDGYIDHYKYVYPILNKKKIQGSFFVPAEVLEQKKLLEVNKIHYLLATGKEDMIYKFILDCIKEYNRNSINKLNIDYLISQYAITSRFDNAQTIFIKRMLQTVLPKELRNKITKELLERILDIDETTLSELTYVNKEQLREMKAHNMHIGLHSYQHEWLGNVDNSLMKTDFDRAYEILKEFINEDTLTINYPYGSYNDKVVNYAKLKGCKLGFTTEVRVADLKKDNRLLLPRLDCNDFPPKSNNYTIIP